MSCYGDDHRTSTPEQQARHDEHAEIFCEYVKVLLDLAATHKERRVRDAAMRSLWSFALLKADPAGSDALCGPKVKQAIENAVLFMEQSPSAEAN